jgi:two-component system nitrogen regulation sensor histidine kinase GlnL
VSRVPAGAARRKPAGGRLAGLDLLASAVVLLDEDGNTVFMNQAAEQLFEVSLAISVGHSFARLFADPSDIERLLAEARARSFGEKRTELRLERPLREPMQLMLSATVLDEPRGELHEGEALPGLLLIEFREFDQRWRLDREQRLLDSAQANRELVRNLAHEIRNPLGGIRGAAQLLETELASPALHEYTRVIIKEADRLQLLVDRLLAPHRHARVVSEVNIHEVCEWVRSLVLAEFPQGLVIRRDYDASLPEIRGDREQLIQALLNLVRNAAQSMEGRGEIVLRTRIARQVTVAKQRWKLALDLHVIDDGPGVPEEIKDRVFFPLVSGRDGGTGLGLTLAQSFVQQHGGLIECDSRPGRTDFRILLPLPRAET